MPTREHQIWLELIQRRPSLVADLLECVHADGVPEFGEAQVESGDLTEHTPTEYRADAVVTLLAKGQAVLAVIVEVQRVRTQTSAGAGQLMWRLYEHDGGARPCCW